ncbi:slr1601 family putative cell division protein [Coleofasciculus sp. G2-EDA-02]|uniref:slr1601 family putative cell division protein n=1 Tax=Coleofasciculus sp. G2-EDA-02 TaxID=3069529 RepID=UPI0033043C6C
MVSASVSGNLQRAIYESTDRDDNGSLQQVFFEMNAIPTSRPTRQPLPTRRRVTRQERRPRRHSYSVVAGEITAKLVVNVILCTAAIAGLAQLLPYHFSQRAKLQEVRAEVKRTQSRVKKLRNDFGEAFDPAQARQVMQDQSYRVDPNQRQVVWEDRRRMPDN